MKQHPAWIAAITAAIGMPFFMRNDIDPCVALLIGADLMLSGAGIVDASVT